MTTQAGPLTLRPLRVSDEEAVESMTRAVGVFRDDEIPIAIEVFLATARGGDTYEGLAAERDGRLAGWISWGPTPCTLGTFDLYWIVVAPDCQGQGVGMALLEAMERTVAGRARLIVVETSSRSDYQGTRSFYIKHGYALVAQIANYYASGDDKLTFIKSVLGPD